MNPRPDRQIIVQTYEGAAVSNSIDIDPTPGMIGYARANYPMLLANVKQVGPPSGRYNCHGLVFGNRRTNIPAAGEDSRGLLQRLLQEDHFISVDAADVTEGDIVLWWKGDDAYHSAIVSHVQQAPFRAVLTWSMWGGLGEFVHPIAQTPYGDCRIDYWRLV